MKLLIDTKGKRVLFAEAGKECVDFLFHILSLPIATVIRLLQDQGMVGSLPNLYKSLESLGDAYIQPDQSKDAFLKPMVCSPSVPLLALADVQSGQVFYRCTSCCSHISDDPRAVCPLCSRKMTRNMPYVAPPAASAAASGGGGLVKEVVTFMVMDDLVVTPMSAISSLTMLSKFNIKEVGGLKEKVVNLGMDEAVKLLKTSLQSSRVFDRCVLLVQHLVLILLACFWTM